MEHMHKGFKMLLQFVNNRKKWQKVMFFLSCVVVFVTTYALILPAITLEQQAAENEAGIILGTDDVFLPDGYDTPAPDNVRYSDAGIIDGQDTDVPEDTDANDIDELFTDGANNPADVDADDTVNDGTEDLVSSDIASETIDYSAEDSSPLFNEYDTQDGNTLRVSVSYGEDAEIPQGAELITTEICQDTEASDTETEYDRYLSEAADALGCDVASIKYARFFNISIVDSNGEEIQPAEGSVAHVSVSLEDEAVENEALSVVHFGEQTDVMDTTADAESICFETTGFSIYAFIETVLEKTVLASDGQNYKVTVTCEEGSGFPETAELSVEEITDGYSVYGKSYEEYVADTEYALGIEEGTTEYIRVFDISIVDREDHSIKYQPAEGSSVDVTIELADADSDCLNVIHFPDDSAETETVQSSTEAGENGSVVEFRAESFSVYSIVDAPEPVPIVPAGWYTASSLDEIEELGSNGFYLSHKSYYLTGELIHNVTGDSDRDGLVGTLTTYNSVPEELVEKFYFVRQEGTDQFKIYIKGEGDTKNYVKMTSVSGNVNRAGLTFVPEESEGTAFTVEKNGNSNSFYISAVVNNTEYWWNRNNKTQGEGAFAGYNSKGDNNTAKVTLSYFVEAVNDPYELDDKTFGIAYNDNSATAAAMSANTGSNQNRLAGVDMLIRNDVLDNNGILLVAGNSDIQEWTFVSAGEDKYYIKTTVDGEEKYLHIQNGNVTLVDMENASEIKATPGTDENSGKWHFSVGNYSLNYTGSSSNDFDAKNDSRETTWLNLVEKSTLTDDDFVEYSARKISASDDILSATEKDDSDEILVDDEGNPVYRTEKTKVVIYTRVWNETTKKYEFYAVDHDGSLIRVYDSGDQINWVGNQVNSALWEFTEYTNEDGTPSNYYELENTAYSNTYLAPQSSGIIADHPVGINLEGRQEGLDYTSILAWDQPAYAYSGLKVEDGKVVTCPRDEADDFYFAVVVPPVLPADPPTTVETVDNNEHGISMRMIDFNNQIIKEGSNIRDSVQHAFFGGHAYDQDNADSGLLSTNLTNGYPSTTDITGNAGRSLSELFTKTDLTTANKLFIQSVYNESGYFEYDSTQNFAHLNEDGDFTVYNQLAAIGNYTSDTRTHGQFMPYNDISAEVGYAYDTRGNLITNKTDVLRKELPDSDPRKGEPLYSIPDVNGNADYFFGMELSASFTQTPNGLDNWGHDIIFEFTGDDDFWLYVDDELVLDLGGIHSAMPGSVNFRTGEVVVNRTTKTLYDIFRSNYQARGMTATQINSKLAEIFETKEIIDKNGQPKTVHVFKDYTKHTMNMFYMERGAGASNLKMRFNLASVQPGTAELTKKLKGTNSASNKLIQYPYQIWYREPIYQMEGDTIVHDPDGNPIITGYGEPIRMVQGATSSSVTGVLFKGSKKKVPYKKSLKIGGTVYNDVFLLKAGQTAVIKFPNRDCKYEIVECGVDTEVYEQVSVNGEAIDGTLYNNTDTGATGGTTERRQDFGIEYETTDSRPKVEYSNQVAPGVMRDLSFTKLVYDSEGNPIPDNQLENINAKFNFRLYLGDEFSDENDLALANMYSYYVKAPGGSYCRWNSADQCFEELGITNFEGSGGLEEYLSTASSAEKSAIVFTTSLNGAIANIPAGYTVEVRDLIVGTKYKVDEPDREIPKGYTRREGDGYVRTDLDVNYVYYTDEEGIYGKHPAEGNRKTAKPISDTIIEKTESPKIEVRNQEGWGLTAEKEWTDKDFIIHDPIYLAVYLADEDGNPGTLINGTVRRLNTGETEVYWFFPDLKIDGETYHFDQFIVREVNLTAEPPSEITVNENGVVTGYTDIAPVDDGGTVSVSGKTHSGTERTENYTVNYEPGESTGQNANIRTDTVTNSRPGIQIFKTDWSGENYLSGAEFTLKDSDGNDVGYASYTSNSKGLVTTAYLNEGTFTLNEIKTPSGYAAPDGPITINVTTTRPSNYDLTVTSGTTIYYIVLSGPEEFFTSTDATEETMASITVKNRIVQELKVVKVGVDGNTRNTLSNVHFALYDQVKDSEGNVRPAYTPKTGYEDIITNDDGILEELTMDVGTGTYYLREKAAPSGYKKLAEDLCFTIGRDGSVVIHNAGYANWLIKDTSVAGTVSYQINIENTPLGITIRKTDEEGNAIPGSKFVLYKQDDDTGSFNIVTDYELGEEGLIDLSDRTEMTFTGMANGVYKLSETTAPPGYIILTKDIYFRVSDGAVTLTNSFGNPKTYSNVNLIDNNSTIVVKNALGKPLPSTGGPGTKHIYLIGCILTLFAGAGIIMKQKWREAA